MSSIQTSAKSERLEARVTPEQKQLIQHAADLEGRSITDFVIEKLQAAALETVRTHETMVLTMRDSIAFVEAIINPPEPNDALRAAAADYRAFTGE